MTNALILVDYQRDYFPGGAHPLYAPEAAVAPVDGETVVVKHWPNGFLQTSLLDDLRAVSADRVTVIGMMTNMCIDATVRAASDLGFDVTVAADACAASPLRFGERLIDGESVQAAFLAALDGTYARVLPADEVTPA